MSNLELQKSFEDICLRQKFEQAKSEKEDLLEEIEVLIYDALSECDYVKNNLIVSEPNLDALYESILFAINSIKSATKDIEKLTKMLDSE